MTPEDYAAAVATLGESDFTKDGMPKLKALNAALEDAGLYPIGADTRDEFHENAESVPDVDEEVDEEAICDDVTFTLVDAPTSPLTLRVYGLGEWELTVGKTHSLPLAAYNSLCQTNATVKEE